MHGDATCYSITGTRPAPACCQSHAAEQSHRGPVSFISSYRGRAGLITVCAAELRAQCGEQAAQQPTGSIKGPDGFQPNSDVTETLIQACHKILNVSVSLC